MLAVRDPRYPLKTAWRFVLLVYISCGILMPLFLTSAHWIPRDWANLGTGLFIVTAWFGWLLLSCCFAFAGAGWAVYSLVRGGPADRRSAVAALLINLLAAAALSGYLLLFTGVIHV